MLSDFIPEAIALVASFATGNPTANLLAAMIAIQNLPEGFNAYREMTVDGKNSGRRVIISFLQWRCWGHVPVYVDTAGFRRTFTLSPA